MQLAHYKLGRHKSNINDICCLQVSKSRYKPCTGILSAPATHCPRMVGWASTYRLLTNFCSFKIVYSSIRSCRRCVASSKRGFVIHWNSLSILTAAAWIKGFSSNVIYVRHSQLYGALSKTCRDDAGTV